MLCNFRVIHYSFITTLSSAINWLTKRILQTERTPKTEFHQRVMLYEMRDNANDSICLNPGVLRTPGVFCTHLDDFSLVLQRAYLSAQHQSLCVSRVLSLRPQLTVSPAMSTASKHTQHVTVLCLGLTGLTELTNRPVSVAEWLAHLTAV